MPAEIAPVFVIAAAAAVAPLAGTALALWHRPSTLLMSIALGFAGGALIGTVMFEMVPRALELAPTALAVGAFAAGYLLLYAFDLALHRGEVAGEHAEERRRVAAYHRWRKPIGTEATVLAGGTLIEEVIEGATIGVGVSVEPALAGIIALAVAIDSFGEGASIVELIREEERGRATWSRAIRWTSAMSVALFASAILGWLFLRGLPEAATGALFAFGGGGFIYLTLTKLIPEGEARQYEQSAALAAGAGLVLMMILGVAFLRGT